MATNGDAAGTSEEVDFAKVSVKEAFTLLNVGSPPDHFWG